MKIRAHAIKQTGGIAEPFEYETTLGSHDVLVKITHRSHARGDIQFIDNAWGDTRFPLAPAMKSLASSKKPVQRSPTSAPVIGSASVTSSRPVSNVLFADGHLAIQFLHKSGHSVTAFSHSPHKRGLIERLGGAFADSSGPTRLAHYQGAFDFILSTLNVPFDLDSFVRMLSPQGQLCMVASPLEQLSLSGGQLNNSRRSIYGNYIGSRSETVQMLEFAATHGIEAVVDVMPLARVNEAIGRIRRRDVEMALVLGS